MNTGTLTLLLTSIPPLVGVAAKVYLGSSDGRLVRKIEKDIALYDIAPERSKELLEPLVFAEMRSHAQRRLNATNRKTNWAVVFWLVVGVALIGLAGWGVAYAALTYWWPLWFLFAAVSFFGVLWIIAGAGTLFTYPDPDADNDDADDG